MHGLWTGHRGREQLEEIEFSSWLQIEDGAFYYFGAGNRTEKVAMARTKPRHWALF